MVTLKSLRESNNKSIGLRKFLVSKPLTSFFVMACLFSWIVLIPYILSQWYILPKSKSFDIFFVANAFVGPMLAAYIMIRTLEGKDAWRRFRKSIWKIKVGLKWYLFALLLIPAVMYVGMVIIKWRNSEIRRSYRCIFYYISFLSTCRILWWWSISRGNRLEGLCFTTYAIQIWTIKGNPASSNIMGFLASATFLNDCSKGWA